MSPEDLVVGGRLPAFVSACRARGKDWFESTVSAEDAAFSYYVGRRLGWRTLAGAQKVRQLVTHPLARFMLLGDIEDGPFAADAQWVLGRLADSV